MGNIVTFSTEVSNDASPVVALQILYVPGDKRDAISQYKLLAIYCDGTVSCHSHDLVNTEWVTNTSSILDSSLGLHVEHAVAIGIDVARQSLLKGREDILPAFANTAEEADGNVLVMIARTSEDGLNLLVLYVDAEFARPGLSNDDRKRLKLLSSSAIQEPSQFRRRPITITIHPASAMVYLESAGTFAIYNSTGLIFRLIHVLERGKDAAKKSYLRLSTNLIACSSNSTLSIIELPYCSTKAEERLSESLTSSHVAPETDQGSQLHLLSYYPPVGLAIALHDGKLLGIQLSNTLPRDGGSRKRKRDGLLINAIGRGSVAGLKSPPKIPILDHKARSIGTYIGISSATVSQREELQRYAAHHDTDQFEARASSLLGCQPQESNKLIPRSTNGLHANQHAVYIILSGMFYLDEAPQSQSGGTRAAPGKLRVRILPRKVFDYLVKRGLLTISNVEKSLKQVGALPRTSQLSTEMIVGALAEWDSSLELLSIFIDSHAPLGAGELVHALALVTRDATASQATGHPNLVTNGLEELKDDDVLMQHYNEATKSMQNFPLDAFPEKQCHHRLLQTILRKLSAITASSVSQALKTQISTPELRTLVDFLRMEIARSGWLYPYDDPSLPLPSNPSDNQYLSHITHLLNSIIDSIGAAGWIIPTLLTDDFLESADTISYMQAEVSAALEGVEEATYLKGMLEEVLICGKEALRKQVEPARAPGKQMAVIPTKPLTVPPDGPQNVLPLGLKLRKDVSTTKVAAGGELKRRSRRDIGRLKSRMVEKYSFERIMI